ncbi:bifunctional metallophosphatase/5'-nucleotidase [Prevotella sp.]|jgi:5''-nucleotidase/2'',3''-cyclic phosphodiesterase and related esterases|uniref:bifunctional metallophosphatase/5'-nucleotidase n=1 Tax=Prevotella sp. TaxID=59823 RepID=UPI003DA569BB
MRNITLAIIALFMCSSAFAKQKTISLKIIETSDVHGSFFPYDFANRQPRQGSMARVSSYVKRQRNAGNVVLLDNGDILQGQPTSYFYNYVATNDSNIAANVINYMKYDAETLGNHDVEPGHAVYDKWIKEVKCPMIACNVVNAKTGKPYVKPYTIIYRNGVKIAVMGMLTPAIPNWLTKNLWQGLRFENMVTAAKKWMRVIKQKEHPDLIIGLFHSGKSGGITTSEYEEDASLKVATQVPGFDVVMFGHDHTRDNEMIKNVAGKNVLCIDPANNALTVAEAQIELTYRHGRVIRKNITGNLVDVTKEDVDSAYMDHFKPQIEKINNYVDRIIGNFNNTISTRDCYFGSSAFNDFILNLQLQITNADVAFNAPLQFDASIKAGPVRVADMFNLYRFENQLYVMRMTGEEIRKHLEMSYDLWVNTMKSADDHLLLLSDTRGDAQRLGFKNFTFNFDSAAGIDYVVDVTKPDGEKVKIMCMSDGRHFDENKWYKVALNSYRGNGGGELLTKGAGIPKDSLDSRIIYRSPRDQRYYLMQEIEKMGTVYAKPNNNWKFIPEEWTVPAAKRDSVILFEHKADAKDEK